MRTLGMLPLITLAVGCGSDMVSGSMDTLGSGAANSSAATGGSRTTSAGGSQASSGAMGGSSAKPSGGASASILGMGGSGGAPVGTCEMPGGPCSASLFCCTNATCVNDRANSVTVCAANCSDNNQCTSGCCAQLSNSADKVCSPTCAPLPAPPAPAAGCGRLVLVADDNTFLGEVTGNKFAADSVCNEFGSYGSRFSNSSIFNQFGSYGSDFSSSSAYNKFTSTPPTAFCENSGKPQFYVTKNTFLSSAIDPDVLCATLQNAGI